MTTFRLCFPLAAALALFGCASFYRGSGLVPGVSTGADVAADMGRPAEIIKLPGGESLWTYPRGLGRQTYAVRLGADDRVRSLSQVLTLQNLARLEPGRSTPEDVKLLLGPPFRTTEMARLRRDVWEYYLYEDTRPIIVYLQFDPSRRLREVLRIDDPSSTNLGA
jgi:SmpA / OmlA family